MPPEKLRSDDGAVCTPLGVVASARGLRRRCYALPAAHATISSRFPLEHEPHGCFVPEAKRARQVFPVDVSQYWPAGHGALLLAIATVIESHQDQIGSETTMRGNLQSEGARVLALVCPTRLGAQRRVTAHRSPRAGGKGRFWARPSSCGFLLALSLAAFMPSASPAQADLSARVCAVGCATYTGGCSLVASGLLLDRLASAGLTYAEHVKYASATLTACSAARGADCQGDYDRSVGAAYDNLGIASAGALTMYTLDLQACVTGGAHCKARCSKG